MSGLLFSWQADPRTWPKVPSAFVFLADAFNEVGRALYPEAWTGREALPQGTPCRDKVRALELGWRKVEAVRAAARLPRITRFGMQSMHLANHSPPTVDAHVLEYLSVMRRRTHANAVAAAEDNAAIETAAIAVTIHRRDSAAEWIAHRARDSALETFGLWSGGGCDPLPLPPGVWIAADDWALFEQCQTKRWSAGKQYPYFLLVTRESLDRELSTLLTAGPEPGVVDTDGIDAGELQADRETVPEPGRLESAAGTVVRRGRRAGVGGFAASDDKLVPRMLALLESGVADSPWAAAGRLAGEAKGSPEPGVREKRLVARFYLRHPERRV